MIWNVKTTECVRTLSISTGTDVPVNSVLLMPREPGNVVVCDRSNTVRVMDVNGRVLRKFSSGKSENGDFVSCAVTPRGRYIFCVDESRILYAFSTVSGKLEHSMTIHDNEVIGLTIHPHQNIIASHCNGGKLKILKP